MTVGLFITKNNKYSTSMEELTKILQELQQDKISVNDAEQQVLDLFDVRSSLFTSKECNCCYMTVGEHSTKCPQYIKNND